MIGDTFFTGGAYKVIIAVTIPRVLEEPQHVLLPNTCSICDIRLLKMVLWCDWSIFGISDLQNGKKQWLRLHAVGAQNGAFLLLRTRKLRAVPPPHTPWLGTTPPLRLAMQQRG